MRVSHHPLSCAFYPFRQMAPSQSIDDILDEPVSCTGNPHPAHRPHFISISVLPLCKHHSPFKPPSPGRAAGLYLPLLLSWLIYVTLCCSFRYSFFSLWVTDCGFLPVRILSTFPRWPITIFSAPIQRWKPPVLPTLLLSPFGAPSITLQLHPALPATASSASSYLHHTSHCNLVQEETRGCDLWPCRLAGVPDLWPSTFDSSGCPICGNRLWPGLRPQRESDFGFDGGAVVMVGPSACVFLCVQWGKAECPP